MENDGNMWNLYEIVFDIPSLPGKMILQTDCFLGMGKLIICVALAVEKNTERAIVL